MKILSAIRVDNRGCEHEKVSETSSDDCFAGQYRPEGFAIDSDPILICSSLTARPATKRCGKRMRKEGRETRAALAVIRGIGMELMITLFSVVLRKSSQLWSVCMSMFVRSLFGEKKEVSVHNPFVL